MLAEDLSVVAITPAAERWLAEVAEADWPGKRAVPYAVSAVVGRMLALEQGEDGQSDLLPRLRLHTASGHWLVLHASRLSATGQIAVIFEVARPAEIAPLIMQWCTGTALWYRIGHPPLPIRWVLTRDPAGKRPVKALLYTDQALSAETIICT